MGYNIDMERFTTAIIGGGASGLFLAASLHNPTNVILFERGDRVGRKLSATGNGQGNITNLRANETEYFATEKSDAEKKLWLNVSYLEEADLEELMDTLTYYEGQTPVYFVKDGKKMMCSQKVTPNRALMAELCAFLDESCIKLL